VQDQFLDAHGRVTSISVERRLARHLLLVIAEERKTMEALMIGAALTGSFATAFVIQRAVLEAFFRAIESSRQVRD
jgi:hypothetical protein